MWLETSLKNRACEVTECESIIKFHLIDISGCNWKHSTCLLFTGGCLVKMAAVTSMVVLRGMWSIRAVRDTHPCLWDAARQRVVRVVRLSKMVVLGGGLCLRVNSILTHRLGECII